jgi:Asp-tRNA(Asn)/Glu-tRNA(Gln) amidotransferase A subunit family amidase
MEGKLHYEEDVKALWNNIVVAAKSKLASIGVKLAPQLRGETDEGIIQEHIDREVYEALKEISEYNADDFEQELLGRLEDEGEAESEDN